MIKIVIIGARKQEREKIASFFLAKDDIRVLGQGKDGYDALKLIGSLKPDIVLMDDYQQDFIGWEDILPLIKSRSPCTAPVILTSEISDQQLCRAAINKVSGLVCKKTDMEMLPEILRYVFKGGCFISPLFSARVLQLLSMENACNREIAGKREGLFTENPRGRARETGSKETEIPYGGDPTRYLSKTELSILTHVGEGRTNREIAQNLGLAAGTVRNYVSSVMRKTGLGSRSQMVRYAFSKRLCC